MTTPAEHTQEARGAIKNHYIECGTAIGGGILDATVYNIGRRLREVAFGIYDVGMGAVKEPLWGIGRGIKELFTLHPGNAVMRIADGFRMGFNRILHGVTGMTFMPFRNFIHDAVSGGARVATGITGLVGLGGDMGPRLADEFKRFAQNAGAAAAMHVAVPAAAR